MSHRDFRVIFQPYGKRIKVKKDSTILNAAQLAGIKIRSICGGKGTCGKCKVLLRGGETVISESHHKKFLNEEDIEKGYRLACKTMVQGDVEIAIPPESRLEGEQILSRVNVSPENLDPAITKILFNLEAPIYKTIDKYLEEELDLDHLTITQAVREKLKEVIDRKTDVTFTISNNNGKHEIINLEFGNTTKRNFGLAIDIGTTTIVAYLVDLNNGSILETISDYNPQIIYGEDLLSRIEYVSKVKEGLSILLKAAVETINKLIQKLTSRSGIEKTEVADVCIAGNTVMTHLLTGNDPTYLLELDAEVSREPFIGKARMLDIEVNPEAGLYILPSVSRFVGGDAVGDIVTSGLFSSLQVSALIDMGTNGEIILGSKGWILASSCASGPAFEGWEIAYGTRGITGAIDHVVIDRESFKAKYSVIGGKTTKVNGICGSGLIDAIAEMFSVGLLDSQGRIQTNKSSFVGMGLRGPEYVIASSEETESGKDIVVTQKDVDNFLESKAAVCATTATLMKKIKASVYDVENVYLAGAFGSYMDIGNAIKIGIFPEFPRAKIVQIGNGAIGGAYLALLSKQKRKEINDIAKITAYFDMNLDADFMDEFSVALTLPGNPSLFPSVKS